MELTHSFVSLRPIMFRNSSLGHILYLVISLSVFLVCIKFYIGEKYIFHPRSKLQSVRVYHYDIEILLEKAREKIRSEVDQYDFKYAGVRLEDLMLENGGQPLRTLIVSAQRSGSTFFGSLLSSMPGTYFYNEGLRPIGYKTIREPSRQAVDAIRYIKDLFQCNHHEYYKIHKKLPMYLRNARLWEYCEHRNELYFDPKFTNKMCKLFPFQVMKLVRIRLKLLEELLQDKLLKVKIILLVRDPRAVMQSRYDIVAKKIDTTWPKYKDGTFPPDKLCGDMTSNYETAVHLLQKYPDRFMALRYEDLISNFEKYSKVLLQFLRQRETPQWKEFLTKHTNQSNSDVYKIFRVSKNIPYRWKKILNSHQIEHIQSVCSEAMELWGYRTADNTTHVQDDNFNPLKEYSFHL